MPEFPYLIRMVAISPIDGKSTTGREEHQEAYRNAPEDNKPVRVHFIPREAPDSHADEDCWCSPKLDTLNVGKYGDVRGLIHNKVS